MLARVAAVLAAALLGSPPHPAAGDATPHRTVIPHLDGTGRATIVEIEPDVPGAARFLAATPEPIPAPGEVILPPRATPVPRPTPGAPPRPPLTRPDAPAAR